MNRIDIAFGKNKLATKNMKSKRYSNNLLSATLLSCALLLAPQISVAEQSVDVNYEKALIAFQEEKLSTAIIYLKNTLKQDPEHLPAHVLMAEILLAQGNGIAAEVELNKARAGHVDDNRLVTLFAKSYLLQSRFDAVLDIAKPSVRGDLIESELYILSGQAYIGKKQYSLADKAFISALALTSKSQLALLGRAQIAFQRHHADTALEFVNVALSSAKPFANGWIVKSKILHELGDIKGSMVAIDEALVISPNHFSARLTKAMLLIELGEFEQALPHVDFILEEIPNEPRAGYLKAIINASMPSDKAENGAESENKKLIEVIATLAAVPPEIMKNTPDYYYLAGLTNFQYGNLNDAYRYLTQYLNYAPFDIETVRMIATIDLRKGELNSARHILTKTNVARPDDPNILTLLGLTYLQLEDNVKAQFYFEKVVNSYPDSAVGVTNLARSKMQSGDYQSAIDALSAIKDNQVNGVQIKLLLVDSYQSTHKYKLAIDIVKDLIKQYPKDSFFQQRIGTLYGLNGDLPLARKAFEQALIQDENNIIAMVHLGRMDNIAGDYDKALVFLQEKLALFEKNVLLMTEISDTYLFKRDIENASTWINKAYAQDPNDFYVVSKLSRILSQQGKLTEAVDVLDSFIGQNPKQPQALLSIAKLYQQQNKHQQAVLALRDYVSKSIHKPKALIQLAKAQLKANDTLGAIQSYKKAIVADDQYLPTYLGLVNLITKNKDESYALILINDINKILLSQNDQADDKQASFSLVDVLKGDLYLALGDGEKAATFYKKALEKSDQKQAIIGLYRSYKQLKQDENSIPALKAWLKKYPDDMLVAISLADSYKSSGDLALAAQHYQGLLKKYGQLPILLNNAASIEFSLGNKAQAKTYAEQAHQYLPDNVAIMDTYAWILTRLDDNETALALFRKALTKDYDNAEVKYHIAVTLHALERNVEAKKYLIESIDSEQFFPEKDVAISLLKTW